MGFPTKNDHFGVWNRGNFYILLLYWLLVYSIVLVKKLVFGHLSTDSCFECEFPGTCLKQLPNS